MFSVVQNYAFIRDNADNLQKIKNADRLCQRVLEDLRTSRPRMQLDVLVIHIEKLLDFKRSLVDCIHVRPSPSPPKKRSRADVAEIERMASQIAAKIQKTKKK
jgi:hypothetical protein